MDDSLTPRIIHIRETGSTNADAMRLAQAGEPLPFWVRADVQTAGRGRAGRTWVSRAGNLHASFACHCGAPLLKAGQLSLVAGIAVFDAIRDTMELAPEAKLRIKWPNDILIDVAKAGGILVESTSAREGPGFLAVMGFGLNLVEAPGDVGREVTALAAYGTPPDAPAVLDALSRTLPAWLDRWDAGDGFDAIRDAWLQRAGDIGEPILIKTASGQTAAIYRGLSETGGLLAEIDGQLREVTFGDVALAAEVTRDGAA
jgi:BirA family transcriptional regulator, biotin operon repressor / biotin---[acetyl-CoA-carboxylase] ligase